MSLIPKDLTPVLQATALRGAGAAAVIDSFDALDAARS